MYYPIKNSLFDEFFKSTFNKEEGNLNMKTDIRLVNNNYVLDIDLPGYDKKDINITLEDGYLTVKAKKVYTDEEKNNKGDYVRRERFTGTCSRSYYVGEIDDQCIDAKFENGVLTLSFPKEKLVEENKKIMNIK